MKPNLYAFSIHSDNKPWPQHMTIETISQTQTEKYGRGPCEHSLLVFHLTKVTKQTSILSLTQTIDAYQK